MNPLHLSCVTSTDVIHTNTRADCMSKILLQNLFLIEHEVLLKSPAVSPLAESFRFPTSLTEENEGCSYICQVSLVLTFPN